VDPPPHLADLKIDRYFGEAQQKLGKDHSSPIVESITPKIRICISGKVSYRRPPSLSTAARRNITTDCNPTFEGQPELKSDSFKPYLVHNSSSPFWPMLSPESSIGVLIEERLKVGLN
jgi:hypothetical protein